MNVTISSPKIDQIEEDDMKFPTDQIDNALNLNNQFMKLEEHRNEFLRIMKNIDSEVILDTIDGEWKKINSLNKEETKRITILIEVYLNKIEKKKHKDRIKDKKKSSEECKMKEIEGEN